MVWLAQGFCMGPVGFDLFASPEWRRFQGFSTAGVRRAPWDVPAPPSLALRPASALPYRQGAPRLFAWRERGRPPADGRCPGRSSVGATGPHAALGPTEAKLCLMAQHEWSVVFT